ncbi:MAG: hypothetical protein SGI97_01275 [candidate division Zixibacteria bacterium]|nr:hypothetical protein [candidate division Zixibacteria bacterium]
MIKEFVVCDSCTKVIASPEDGFVVKGNIYAADHGENPDRLVGDNFPRSRTFAVRLDEIGETGICRPCLMKALGLNAGAVNTRVEKLMTQSA